MIHTMLAVNQTSKFFLADMAIGMNHACPIFDFKLYQKMLSRIADNFVLVKTPCFICDFKEG